MTEGCSVLEISLGNLCLSRQRCEDGLWSLGGNWGIPVVAEVAGCYDISVARNGGSALQRILKIIGSRIA